MKNHILKISLTLLSSISVYASDLVQDVDTSKVYHVKFSNAGGESGTVCLDSKKIGTYSSTKSDKDESLIQSGTSYSFERFISTEGKPSLRIKYSKTGKANKSDSKNFFIQSLQSQIFVVSDLKLHTIFKTFDGKMLTVSVKITDATGRPLAK